MAEAQSKYLSPRGILTILTRLEYGITRVNKMDYKPGIKMQDGLPIEEDEINQEAMRMLTFMGMTSFNPICKYDLTLSKGIAGQIILDGKGYGDLHISIGAEYKARRKELIACLAHELCHKLLEQKGITFPNTKEGVEDCEYHTDLCTIFMGFGRLIIDGYNVGNNCMGYLRPSMYRQAYNIIQIIRNQKQEGGNLENVFSDPFLDEALAEWNGHEDKHKLINSVLRKKENEIAAIAKDTYVARQVLEIVDDILREYGKWCSKSYEIHALNSNLQDYPIHAFASLYNLEINGYDEAFRKKLLGIDYSLRYMLASLEKNAPELSGERILYNQIVCPFCGMEKEKKDIAGEKRIVRCGTCNRYFLIDRTSVNRNEFRCKSVDNINETSKLFLDGVQKGMKEGSAETKRELEKHFQSRIAEMQCEFNKEVAAKYEKGVKVGMSKNMETVKKFVHKDYEDKIKDSYDKGRHDGRLISIEEAKRAIIRILPFWCRWLFKILIWNKEPKVEILLPNRESKQVVKS